MPKPYEITFFWSKRTHLPQVMNLASSAFLNIIALYNFVKVSQFVPHDFFKSESDTHVEKQISIW